MPLGESMLSTLRSNKSIMLDKSKRFRKTLGGYGPKRKVQYDLPSASSAQLKSISQKLKAERKKFSFKLFTIALLIIFSLVLVIFAL